ncbi:hypothetical protein J437_LFUL012455 [Ladona fulva]|uniref:Uncharacterized protein n=1 Tax=Ladona fulva TaxID=123851 RepID=A0A8K0KEA0_LADFU|nr:hypothetical protein J437_LFUL012455 [Ladona fulva]
MNCTNVCETWAIKKCGTKKTLTIEIWFWKRVTKTRWTDMKTNEQSLSEDQQKSNETYSGTTTSWILYITYKIHWMQNLEAKKRAADQELVK